MNRRVIRLLASGIASCTITAFVVAAPSTAYASDTTPYVQLVVSHVRFVSFVSTPEVGAAANVAFDTAVFAQQPYDNARDEGSDGGGRVPLTRDYPSVNYEDANFVHSAQFSFADNRFHWGTRLTAAWQSIATSPVSEQTYWYINNGKAGSSNHVQAPSYQYHGSFAAQPGDGIDMASQFTFECVVNGEEATCHGTLYSSYYIAG